MEVSIIFMICTTNTGCIRKYLWFIDFIIKINHLFKSLYFELLSTNVNIRYFRNAEITVVQPDGSSQEVTIIGIDEYGFLLVKGKRGKAFTVHPDGNSFDILNGLIAPKRWTML